MMFQVVFDDISRSIWWRFSQYLMMFLAVFDDVSRSIWCPSCVLLKKTLLNWPGSVAIPLFTCSTIQGSAQFITSCQILAGLTFSRVRPLDVNTACRCCVWPNWDESCFKLRQSFPVSWIPYNKWVEELVDPPPHSGPLWNYVSW